MFASIVIENAELLGNSFRRINRFLAFEIFSETDSTAVPFSFKEDPIEEKE